MDEDRGVKGKGTEPKAGRDRQGRKATGNGQGHQPHPKNQVKQHCPRATPQTNPGHPPARREAWNDDPIVRQQQKAEADRTTTEPSSSPKTDRKTSGEQDTGKCIAMPTRRRQTPDCVYERIKLNTLAQCEAKIAMMMRSPNRGPNRQPLVPRDDKCPSWSEAPPWISHRCTGGRRETAAGKGTPGR